MAAASEKKAVAKAAGQERGREIQKGGRTMSPFEEIDVLVDRFMERLFPRGWLQSSRWEWPALRNLPAPFEGRRPRVDVIDRDNEIVVRAELPGVKKDDVEVSMTASPA